jgi:hypothetical protein
MGKGECGTSDEAPSISGEESEEPAVPARRLLDVPGRHAGVLPYCPGAAATNAGATWLLSGRHGEAVLQA